MGPGFGNFALGLKASSRSGCSDGRPYIELVEADLHHERQAHTGATGCNNCPCFFSRPQPVMLTPDEETSVPSLRISNRKEQLQNQPKTDPP